MFILIYDSRKLSKEGGYMKKTLLTLGVLLVAISAFAATRTPLAEDFGYNG